MNTKEKLDKKLSNIEIELAEKLQSVIDFDDENEMKKFSRDLNIDINTVEKLFSEVRILKKDKRDYRMLSYISKNSTSGVSLYKDLAKAKEKIENSEKSYRKAINLAKYELFISGISSQRVNKVVVEYLKENKADKHIVKKALEKYASGVKLENNDENVLKYLYENGYEPSNNNQVDVAYKYYSEGRKKDENIKNLEIEITEIEDVIHRNINTIKALNMKVSYYEQTLPNMQSKIKEYAEKAQNSVYTVKELQKQAEVKESFGFFRRIFNKITFFFKKDKPMLLSASLSGIQSDMSAISNGLVRVGDSVIQPDSRENIIKSIQKQKNFSFGFKDVAEPIKSR